MSSTMYDSVEWSLIPRNAGYLAVYSNGQFAADIGEVSASFPKARIYLIDVTGSNPDASIKDVETGDMRVSGLADAIGARLEAHPASLVRVYCNLSTLPSVRDVIANSVHPNQRSQLRSWIANPTGLPHFVPGSNATQYKFGDEYDTSLIGRNFE